MTCDCITGASAACCGFLVLSILRFGLGLVLACFVTKLIAKLRPILIWWLKIRLKFYGCMKRLNLLMVGGIDGALNVIHHCCIRIDVAILSIVTYFILSDSPIINFLICWVE